MWHAQEHYNLYTQPLINLVSAHILGRVRFCLKFYIILCIFFFTKLKRKNTLIFTIQLSWYSSESMLAKIQGLFKTLSWNSRTFQGFTLKFKDFSRLCEPWWAHMSVYLDCISQTKPCVFVYCRLRKGKEELWNVCWYLTLKENDSSDWGKRCFLRVTTVNHVSANGK